MFGSEEGNENQKGAAARAWLGMGTGHWRRPGVRRAAWAPRSLSRGWATLVLVWFGVQEIHGVARCCMASRGAAWHCSSSPLDAPLGANLTAGETSTSGVCSTSCSTTGGGAPCPRCRSGSQLRESCHGLGFPPQQPLLTVNCFPRDLFEVYAPICNAKPPSTFLPPCN